MNLISKLRIINAIGRYGLKTSKQQPGRNDPKINREHQEAFNVEPMINVEEVKKSLLFQPEDSLKIQETNAYFQGIELNTSYAKFYNEDSVAKANNFKNKTISDLPFAGKPRAVSKENKENIKMEAKCRAIFKKMNYPELQKRIKSMCSRYFEDLIKKERNVKIQPNFEREARRAISSLVASNHKFQITPKEKFEANIISVDLFKGIQVLRNDNYSKDSYEIIHDNSITFYRLWQKKSKKLPEEEYFKQRDILMRIFVRAEAPHLIKISKGDDILYSSENYQHRFVFEMNLRHPPKYSFFDLTPDQFIEAYRPVLEELTITNVDDRNPYAAFVFDESMKKNELINKLV